MKRRRRKRRAHAPVGSVTPTPQASPGTAVITTGESARADAEIEQIIDRVANKLAKINRQKLSATQAADYDRINGFIAEARSALQEHDALGARSLADKAARLVSQLAENVSSP